jgi:HEPN domain-containing protein
VIDIDKQVVYWRKGAEEDWEVGLELLQSGKIRHGLFFVNLAVEKILKAHFCRNRRDVAPKVHNLVRLAEIGGVVVSDDRKDVLADINAFSLEGRYPDSYAVLPSRDEADSIMRRAGEVFLWLKSQL